MKLSAEEKELVEAKRLEDLAKQKKVMAGVYKSIEETEKEMEAFRAEQANQNAHARDYHSQLDALYPNTYKIKSLAFSKTFNVYDYVGNREHEERGNKGNPIDRCIWFTGEVSYETIKIVYTNNTFAKLDRSAINIVVDEHFTRRGGFSNASTNHGYKMFIKGIDWNKEQKAMKNPKTVHKNIIEYVDGILGSINSENKFQETQDMLEDHINNLYPQANVNADTDGKRIGNKWYETKIVKALFPNGLEIKFRAYLSPKDELEVVVHKLDTSNIDNKVMIELLIDAPAKEKK